MYKFHQARECTNTSELMDVHQCNKVDFPCCCFVCRCMTSFHSLSTAAFVSRINIAWGERSFIHTCRFPEASVSERQISRIVWTFVTLGFPISTFCLCTHLALVCTPEIRWADQHQEFILLSSQVHTWEYFVLTGLQGYSKNFDSQIRSR